MSDSVRNRDPDISELEASARIEQLLGEVRAMTGPATWPRVEELVQALLGLYGAGLERLVALLPESARPRLVEDELLASLLALHGLHPLPVEERVRAALAALEPQVGPLELAALDDGVARVRLLDAPPIAGVGELVERALTAAAPELGGIGIEGLRAPKAKGALVQIDLQRSRARSGP